MVTLLDGGSGRVFGVATDLCSSITSVRRKFGVIVNEKLGC